MQKFIENIKDATKQSQELNVNKADIDEKVYVDKNMSLIDEFQQEFEKVGGEFYLSKSPEETTEIFRKIIKENSWQNIFCVDRQLSDNYHDIGVDFIDDFKLLSKAEAGLNSCEFIAARTASIIVSSMQKNGRRLNVFAPSMIYVARKLQLVKDIQEGISKIFGRSSKKSLSLISVVTGPSRTADIEKTLILGMHGPKRVLLIYENF